MSNSKNSPDDAIPVLYNELIKKSNLGDLLPFLQEHASINKSILRQEIKKARKYWLEYVNLNKESIFREAWDKSRYGTRANRHQQDIIVLSAIAILDRTEIIRWQEAFNLFNRLNEPLVVQVLEWANPSWCNAYLLAQLKKSEWSALNYIHLRMLADRKLVEYDPELFVLSIARFPSWTFSQSNPALVYVDYVLNDPIAYQRDVPLLFKYETAMHGEPFPETSEGRYNGKLMWEIILSELLADGKMDRGWFIENCILIQTKEWNSNLRSFFRKRLKETLPTPAELVAVQHHLFACLHAPLNTVVNFAVEILSGIWQEELFNFQSFLEFAEPVMMRADCKGSIRTLLSVFDKAATLLPEHRHLMSHMTSDVFVIPDLALQERTWKTLQKIADENDTTLTNKLNMYVPQMQGNIRQMLGSLLDDNVMTEPAVYEDYATVEKDYVMLNDSARVPEFSEWNDLLFHFGKYFQSWEIIDVERLIDAFITKRHLFPHDAPEQLKPYTKQLADTHFLAAFRNWVSRFLIHVIQGKEGICVGEPNELEHSNVNNLTRELVIKAQRKIASESDRPLLCFPTHVPYWIDPSVLIDRLIACHAAAEEIDPTDFAIAIARTRRENVAAAAEKVQLLPERYQDLFKFILGISDRIAPLDSNLIPWAVAARTFHPDRIFPEFEQTDLKDVANVVSPFIPAVRVDEKTNIWTNHFTNETETHTWNQLAVDLPEAQWNGKPGLLYSMDISEHKKHSWSPTALSNGGVLYWHSVMPQNDQALASYTLRYSCEFPDTDGHDDLKGFMHVAAHAGFRFTETAYYVIACCCAHKDSNLRNYTSEVLVYLVTEQRIDLMQLAEKVAFLISRGYAPLQRSLDVVSILKDYSPLHNGALHVFFDSFIQKFKLRNKLPTGFKKLLEAYYDLLTRTQQAPSEPALQNLAQLPQSASLKSILKQLQSIPQK